MIDLLATVCTEVHDVPTITFNLQILLYAAICLVLVEASRSDQKKEVESVGSPKDKRSLSHLLLGELWGGKSIKKWDEWKPVVPKLDEKWNIDEIAPKFDEKWSTDSDCTDKKVHTIIEETKVPYTVEKKVPVPVYKEVPYPVHVNVPQPYAVIKEIPYPVKVTHLVRVPVHKPVAVEKIVKFPVEVI